MDDFSLFTEAPAAMSCQHRTCATAGIYGCGMGSMAAAPKNLPILS